MNVDFSLEREMFAVPRNFLECIVVGRFPFYEVQSLKAGTGSTAPRRQPDI